MLDAIQRILTFLVGSLVLIGGILDDCPRPAVIAVGLLLMGIFTVPQAVSIVKSMITKEGE